MENLRIDENSRWTLGGVANDGSGDIKNARVNPITGALIVEATVTSTNTQIGSTIPGGTAGSVLFLGLGGTLAQDNANFFYDDTNNYLGLGTTTPSATLDVQGTAIITGSAGTPTFVLGRDGSGNVSNIVLGSNLTLTGGVLNATTSGSGYNQIQDNGTNITQRTTLNFVDYFTVTDGSGKTNISINTAELGADTTLISTLETNMDLANISGQIDLSTQVTGTLSSTNIDITNLESNLDLANIAGQIDLTTQVTGVLPLANGGTGQSLTDPNYDAVYVWDNTTNTTRLAQLSGISYDSGTNILSSTGGSGTATNSGNITQATHGFTIGYPTPIRKDASGIYVKSLAVKTSPSDLSGEVIGIAVASTVNDFVIYYNGQVPTTTTPFSALATGTPLYVSATTAGILTDVEPTGITDISKPIAYVDIETGVNARIVFMNMRGLVEDSSGGGSINRKSGILTGTVNIATNGVQTFTHNLGTIPAYIRLTGIGVWTGGGGGSSQSIGTCLVNTGSGAVINQQSVTTAVAPPAGTTQGLSNSSIFGADANGQYFDSGAITAVTTTTFDLTITQSPWGGAYGGLPKYLWEVSS